MDIGLDIQKSSKKERIAICIPSEPTEVCAYLDDDTDIALRRWWNIYHNAISLYLGPQVQVFLVVEKMETEQFLNCFYKGTESNARLMVRTQVQDVAEFNIRAGFSYTTQQGSLDFKGPVHVPGKKWAIFLKSLKGSTVTLAQRAQHIWRYVSQFQPA